MNLLPTLSPHPILERSIQNLRKILNTERPPMHRVANRERLNMEHWAFYSVSHSRSLLSHFRRQAVQFETCKGSGGNTAIQ